MPTRVLLMAWDLLTCAALVLASGIALTGGTTVAVAGRTISLHSVGNLLVVASCLLAGRYFLRSRAPLFGISRWPLDHIGRRAVRMLTTVSTIVGALPFRRSLILVGAEAIAAALLKMDNAWADPGFFSGDDLEVQEMTIGAALGQQWAMWELRSAFYPMTFIYPLQALLVAVGVVDPALLILAGRLVVIVLSSAGLVCLFLWARPVYGNATALVAAVLLATSVLHIQFGGSELPRSISAIFVVWAFFLVRQPASRVRVAIAGCAIAAAACMRFSEVAFFVPAALQLLAERRSRDLLVFVGVGGFAALFIQGVSDIAYWHSPFFSARQMLQFTLVDRLSSRGYEPPWYYLIHATAWTDLLTIVLAFASVRVAGWRLTLWLWMPIALLSLLPHKEARYLIPSLPFLSLAAAIGLSHVVDRLRGPLLPVNRAHAVAVALVCALVLRTIFVVSGYHVDRTDAEVALAREIDRHDTITSVALESAWRFGWHLYLVRLHAVEDLTPDDTVSPEELRAALERRPVDLGAISAFTCERRECAESMRASGFREMPYDAAPRARYRMFERNK